jgi:superoxide dismutase, Cu-Zn family
MTRLLLMMSVLIGVTACGNRSPDAAPAPADQPLPPPAAESAIGPAAEPSIPPAPVGATAELKATQGNGVSGTLTLAPEAGGVRITGSIKGLTPATTHGFHVHEKGDCSAPDASSAGGHYNPAGHPHGDPAGTQRHLGDMPNAVADAEGAATVDMVLSGATLRSGQPDDILGKSIVVHEKADDYKSQPAGDSGKRIACGIIK